ncbi:glycosyltransferase family 39 protein [Candidatus Woesebacteria bacterium]|nr:glycosyltransferase family 39 protein [Candidatus Woesebacteria bacterium]
MKKNTHFSNNYAKHFVLAIILLAFLLRLPLLNGSFWLDEAAQALESQRPLSQQFDIIDDFQPPFLHLITAISIRFDTSEWWLRSWGALIPGLISVSITYALGKKFAGVQAGLLSALLLATSSFHIFYSQELRPYSLPTACALSAAWFFLKARQQPLKGNWALYSVSNLLGLYSSYLYPFFMLAQIIWLKLLTAKNRKLALISWVISVLGFLPWLPTFRDQLSAGTTVRQLLPGWETVVSIPQLKSLPLVIGKFIFGVVDLSFSCQFIILTTAIIFSISYLTLYIAKNATKQNRDVLIFIVSWLIVPLLLSWIVSFWVPVVQPKRVLFLLPALYLLVGILVTQSFSLTKSIRRIAFSLALCLLLINGWGTSLYFTTPQLQRENWRALHRDITTQFPADQSIVIFSFPQPFAPWVWYDGNQFPSLSTGSLTTNQIHDLPDLLKPVSEKKYVLVFDYLRDLTDPDNKIILTLQSLGYEERFVLDYPQIGFVRVFTRPETVLSFVVR